MNDWYYDIEHAQLLLNAHNGFIKVTILPDYVSHDIQINKYNVVLKSSFVDGFLAF